MFNPIYIKTPNGMWVRASISGEAVVVEAQEMRVKQDGLIASYDPDGFESPKPIPRWQKTPHEAPGELEWFEVGRIEIDDRWASLPVDVMDWPKILNGIQRHVTALLAAGWGETMGDLIDWFSDPSEMLILVPDQVYEIVSDHPPLEGLKGMFARVEREDVDESFLCFSLLGLDTSKVTLDNKEWVIAFLIATHPVVGGKDFVE